MSDQVPGSDCFIFSSIGYLAPLVSLPLAYANFSAACLRRHIAIPACSFKREKRPGDPVQAPTDTALLIKVWAGLVVLQAQTTFANTCLAIVITEAHWQQGTCASFVLHSR